MDKVKTLQDIDMKITGLKKTLEVAIRDLAEQVEQRPQFSTLGRAVRLHGTTFEDFEANINREISRLEWIKKDISKL